MTEDEIIGALRARVAAGRPTDGSGGGAAGARGGGCRQAGRGAGWLAAAVTLPEWFEAWLAGHDVFGWAQARESDGDGPWGDTDNDWPESGIHPDQAALW